MFGFKLTQNREGGTIKSNSSSFQGHELANTSIFSLLCVSALVKIRNGAAEFVGESLMREGERTVKRHFLKNGTAALEIKYRCVDIGYLYHRVPLICNCASD